MEKFIGTSVETTRLCQNFVHSSSGTSALFRARRFNRRSLHQHHYHHLRRHHRHHHHHHHHRHDVHYHRRKNSCQRVAATESCNKLVRFSGSKGLILSISLPLFMIFAKVVSANQVRCNVVTMFRLKTADCIGRQLTSVPSDLDPDLKVFKLSSNSLISLEYTDFHNYVHLHEISLTQNRIEFIYPSTFAPLKLLQVLDLENNGLYEIKDYYFANVSSLRVLILKNNPLHRISDHSFQNLFNLEHLSLESCYLTGFKPQLMKDFGRLQELNLAHNRLTGLDENMRPFLSKSLTVVRLAGNSWHCDCKFRWFRLWLEESSVNWNFPKSAPSCSTPDILRGVEWGQLKHDQFTCPARILGNFSSQTVLQISLDDNLTIDCVVFGDPMPSISWHKTSGQHRQDPDPNGTRAARFFAPATYVSSLKIFSSTEADEGDYKCVAENAAGRSEVTFKVIVKVDLDPAEANKWRIPSGDILLGIGIGVTVLLASILVAIVLFLFKNRPSSRARPVSTNQNGSACKRGGETSLVPAEKFHCLESEGSADDKLLNNENYYIFAPAVGDVICRRPRSPQQETARTFRLADPILFSEPFDPILFERKLSSTAMASSSASPASSTRTTTHSTHSSVLVDSTNAVHVDFTSAIVGRHFETLDAPGSKKRQHRVNFTFENQQHQQHQQHHHLHLQHYQQQQQQQQQQQRSLRDHGDLSKSCLDCRDKKASKWWQSCDSSEIENLKVERLKLKGVPKSALKKKEFPPTEASIILTGATRDECHATCNQARRMSFELAMEEILNTSKKNNKF